MKFLVNLLFIFRPLARKLSLCQLTGSIAGIVTGIILVFLFIGNDELLSVTGQDFWQFALILTAFCWVMMLFFLCGLSKYSFLSVVIPSLVNCFFTCTLTLYICNYLQLWYWAPFIGLVVGIVVGTLLCYLGQLFKK